MKPKFRNLLVGLLLAATLGATEPRTATDAAFFAEGMVAAQVEAASSVVGLALQPAIIPHWPFRQMAGMNHMLAWMFAQVYGVTPFVFYLEGRASAFDQLANLAGEP
jgi:hypothetical protein